jgi:hypothetical protein
MNCLLVYNIFTTIAKKLDVQSLRNVFLINKDMYALFITTRVHTNSIFADKILRELHFSPMKTTMDEQNGIVHQLHMLYNYRTYRRHASFSDYVVFLMNNRRKITDGSEGCLTLFRHILKQCRFTEHATNKKSLCGNDLLYFLQYSDANEHSILLKTLCIPSEIICSSISCISYGAYSAASAVAAWLDGGRWTPCISQANDMIETKLKNSIDYFVMKTCFRNMQTVVKHQLNLIMVTFVENQRYNLLSYTFDKVKHMKCSRYIDFQMILNTAITVESVDTLHFVKYHVNSEDDDIDTQQLIIITHISVAKLCERGSFGFLKHVIDELLGQSINLKLYIDSICDGLVKFVSAENNLSKLEDVKCLSTLLTDQNKLVINECLRTLYITHCKTHATFFV